MYICLHACKKGFKEGCRPIIGIDGCHLKGVFPGMCLVAVGKDGNNNIYPVAWAVVEVENTEAWRWFLELLNHDIGKEEGEGMTFMSDRQKGLLDALRTVVPKANGQVYKDALWNAARATTEADFNYHMDGIKSLSNEAYEYLKAIPPQHWSRHAFGTQAKSNMLLNNLCESFNSVLKEVRDKPILTHMEWMRRYVMKRNFDKREGVVNYKGKVMPYVSKYLQWAREEVRYRWYYLQRWVYRGGVQRRAHSHNITEKLVHVGIGISPSAMSSCGGALMKARLNHRGLC
ncbi:uncharacterized protein LOC141627945 [Silene latifolia]|uniref:uncharacterized protein LOC141627945 n=1 Tax=Silene latifolia TaxID=37657 RepID=UPI003D770D2F